MRAAWAAVVVLVLCAPAASGQPAKPAPPSPAPPGDDSRTWSFSASLYGYLLADEVDYAQPTVAADRGWLHLEARYNYEDLATGSAWLGYNFSGGESLAWEITPMVGAVFGNTDGVAPGYKASLTWRKLSLYTEGEYVFAGGAGESFFYSWSELAFGPVEWFRAGVVAQRTWVYQAEREVNRGILVAFTRGPWDVAAYLFDPFESKPSVVLAASVGF